jgi:rare lipoprotein A
MHAITAAHPTLPMPCYARVTNLANHRSIIVRVNDRGPYSPGRVIDLSSRTADLLGYKGHGLVRVRVEYVGPAPIEGSDDRLLVATLRSGAPAPAPSPVMVASASPFVPQAQAPLPDALPNLVPLPPDRPFDVGESGSIVLAPKREMRSASSQPQKPPRREPVVATSGFSVTPRLPAGLVEPAGGFSARGLY